MAKYLLEVVEPPKLVILSPVLGAVEALVRRQLSRLAGRRAEPAAPGTRLVARPAP